MKFNTALVLATAGSLVAAQAPHRHGHRHLHRRESVTAVSTEVVYVYQLDGQDISVEEVCEGVKEGKYLWADGTAPAGVCATATSSAIATSTSVVAAAEFFEVASSSPTPTTSSSSAFTSSTTSIISLTSSTSTSSSTSSTSTSSSSTSSSSSTAWTTTSATSSSTAASASASSTSTSGSVTIKNSVGKTIYLWTTSDTAGDMVTLPAGESYQESWLLNPDDGGISIKISTTTSKDDIMQFEYTLIKPIIWWDVSLINMETTSLFDKLGFSVTSDNDDCYTVNCPAGETACDDAYLWPTDDQATHSCSSDTNMSLNLGSPLSD